MPRFLLGLVVFGLAVYAVSDVIASTDQRRGNTPKFMWVLITLFIPVLGPIIWLVFSNSQQGQSRASGPRRGAFRGPRPTSVPPTPVAPDDDPEFLWKLEAEKRKRQSQRKPTQDGPSKPSDTPTQRPGSGEQSERDASGASGPDSAQDNDDDPTHP